MCETLDSFIYYVGLYALLVFLYDHLKSSGWLFYAAWRGAKVRNLKKRYGDWAVITGSTDGIGKEYARELARQGINVVLIARNESKLQKVAKEIESEFAVKTRIIVADFSKGESIYPHIERELGNLPIGILINNVGQNTTEPGYLACAPITEVWHLINTNMGSMAHLSHYFLRRMHDAGIKGIIVNVSSYTEMNGFPCITLYAATKAFARSFTTALTREARPLGIQVQLLSPGFVLTKLIAPIKAFEGGNVLVPHVEVYVRKAISTLGRVDYTTGCLTHEVQRFVMEILPWRLRAMLSEKLFPILVDRLNTSYI